MKIRFSYSTGTNPRTDRTKIALQPWDKIVRFLSKEGHVVTAEKGVGVKGFYGAAIANGSKKADDFECRGLLTLDFDNKDLSDRFKPTTIAQVERDLEREGWPYFLYTTWSHTGEGPEKFRLVLPIEGEEGVSKEVHEQMVRRLISRMGWMGVEIGPSIAPVQMMFLPNAQEQYAHAAYMKGVTVGSYVSPGELLGVMDVWDDGAEDGSEGLDGFDGDVQGDVEAGGVDISDADVSDALQDQLRREFGPERVKSLLERLPAEGLDYDGWANVGMALHRHHDGSDDGYALWLDWSSRSSKHDTRQMRVKWDSFARTGKRYDIRSLCRWVNDSRDQRNAELRDAAGDEPEIIDIDSLKAWCEGPWAGFLNDMDLDVKVDEIAAERIGISKPTIRKMVRAARNRIRINEDGGVRWDEANEWCYLTVLDKYVHKSADMALIGPRAFHMTNIGQVRGLETNDERNLGVLFLDEFGGDVAQNKGFDPTRKFGQVYMDDTMGDLRPMLNTARVQDMRSAWGVGWGPADALGSVGDDVDIGAVNAEMDRLESGRSVNALLGWLDWFFGLGRGVDVSALSEEEVERREAKIEAWLDFMSLSVWCVGEKIRWCPVIQSCEGTGKNLVHEALMRAMFGRHVYTADTHELTGRFRGWLAERCMVIMNEVYLEGHGRRGDEDRARLVDGIKRMITDDTVSVEKKGVDSVEVKNFANFIALSNHQDAIPLDGTGNNRRFLFLFSEWQDRMAMVESLGGVSGEREFFGMMARELAGDGGMECLKWLAGRALRGDVDMALLHSVPRGANGRAVGDVDKAVQAGLGYVALRIKELMEEGGSNGGMVDGGSVGTLIFEDWALIKDIRAGFGGADPRRLDSAYRSLGLVKVDYSVRLGSRMVKSSFLVREGVSERVIEEAKWLIARAMKADVDDGF